MIVTQVQEESWLPLLRELPAFEAGRGKLVVVSPHPDDETLGAGGLIAAHCARGGHAIIIAVTDGEHAYDDVAGLGSLRAREQAEAVRVLAGDAATIVRLRLTDSSVAAQEPELTEALRAHVDAETHVIAPWTGDYHPDHEACGRAAARVANQSGARLSWYFFWTWHRGQPSDLEGLRLRRFALTDEIAAQKWAALQQHHSQLHHVSGKPILPDDLLAPAKRNFEVFAEA